MKYKLTDETKNLDEVILHRIECVEAFADVKIGDKGGWIEKESNLSQADDAWVYEDAKVHGNARVFDKAEVWGYAEVCDNAKVFGKAKVFGNAELHGNTEVRTYISKTPDCSTLNFFEKTVKSNGNIDLNELSWKQLIALLNAWNSDFAKNENASFSEMVKRCYKPITWHEDANIIYLHKDNRRTTIISYTFFHFAEAEDKLIHALLTKQFK